MQTALFYAKASPLDLLGDMLSQTSKGNGLESRTLEPSPPLSVLLPMLVTGTPGVVDLIGDAFKRGILMPPGETVDVRSFDVVRQGAQLADRINQTMGAGHPDITTYLGRGSKLLIWHGMGDNTLSPEATMDYYDHAREQALSSGVQPQAFDQAVRLYPVPTFGHCSGDNGPNEADLLGALDTWVAQGQVPDAIPVTQRKADGSVARTRILCPLPEEPWYSGQGSVDQAASFACAVPPDRVGITGIAQPAQ
jgi:tannase/feruloyl esterase